MVLEEREEDSTRHMWSSRQSESNFLDKQTYRDRQGKETSTFNVRQVFFMGSLLLWELHTLQFVMRDKTSDDVVFVV